MEVAYSDISNLGYFESTFENGWGTKLAQAITERQAGSMIHYVYSTRGGYLYMVGRYNQTPKMQNKDEFVLSVPEKTSQAHIDTLAHRKFMEHLRRPRKVSHERHTHKAEKELAIV